MVFAQCLTAPIAVTQPVVYETIESGLAAPAGRGEGGLADDLYALGVTTLALLIGHTPCLGMSDDEILRRKMASGSYMALVGLERVSLTMMEPLRGLLNDDALERWGLEDLVYWINGRRLSPKPQTLPQKAGRAFTVGESGYMTSRDLAQALSTSWDESVEYVRNGTITTWIRRSSVTTTWRMRRRKLPVHPRSVRTTTTAWLRERVSRSIPVRQFATVSSVPRSTALGRCWRPSLTCPMHMKCSGQCYVSIWFHIGLSVKAAHGIERAIYDLNPNQPCLSPMLEREYVNSVDELLPALERVAQRQKGEVKQYVDRHIGAFVAARFRISVNSELHDMDNRTNQYIPIVAAARLLSSVQENQPTRLFPALSLEIAKILEPATNRFHSRRQRKRVRDELRRVSKQGRIFELLNAVDNQAMLSADARSFQGAVMEYAYSVKAQEQLDYETQNRSSLSELTGAQVSSVISGFVTTVVTLVIALVWLF